MELVRNPLRSRKYPAFSFPFKPAPTVLLDQDQTAHHTHQNFCHMIYNPRIVG